jgi:arylsulfatase A-like enzyme/Tfp pilus assembly protein PilF
LTGRRAAALALALALGGCGREAARPGAPVVLVTLDTLRADHLPAWGYRGGATPAIDRLVRDGVRFSNAWTAVPLTLPAHSSLLTGLLPPAHGVRSNVGYRLDGEAHPTLAALLRSHGYATGAAVSAYVLRGATGIASGFERFDDALEVRESAPLGAIERPGGESLAAALGWLAGVERRPFFLWLHLFEPHAPYAPPEPFRGRFASAYDGEIAAADDVLGRLLAELDRAGLYERALVIVAGDHGEGLGDHGEAEHGILLYRETLAVPLVVKLPGGARRGSTVDAPVSLVDVVPTVLARLGIAAPAGLAGVDLLAPPVAGRRIYGETMYPRIHLGWSELRSLVDARYQLIDGPDPELYDLAADPRERDNLRQRERRAFAERQGELAKIPLELAAAAPASEEERRRLAALGYLSGQAGEGAGPRPDPKREIPALAKIEEAWRLAQEGRAAESVELARAVLAGNPRMIDARLQLAASLHRLGRRDEALAEYRAIARDSPPHRATVAIEVGKIELDLGHLDAAAANAELALDAAPADGHLLLAEVALDRGDAALAEREARAAIAAEQRPRLAALVVLAQALAGEGRYAEGLAAIEPAAARLDSGAAEPIATLDSTRGDLLARLGRAGEAEAAFRREIARFPSTAEAYARLAVLLAAGHRFDEIQPTLDALVAAVPSRAGFELAARTMEDLGNRAAASDYRRRAPASTPGGR